MKNEKSFQLVSNSIDLSNNSVEIAYVVIFHVSKCWPFKPEVTGSNNKGSLMMKSSLLIITFLKYLNLGQVSNSGSFHTLSLWKTSNTILHNIEILLMNQRIINLQRNKAQLIKPNTEK